MNKDSLGQLLFAFSLSGEDDLLKKIVDKIKQGSTEEIFCFVFDTNFLFEQDETKTALIDYLLSYDVPMSNSFIEDIYKDIRVIRKFIEHGKFKPNKISETLLFSEIEPGKLLIDYLFENDLIISSNVREITGHKEIIDYIIKYKKQDLLRELSEDNLFEKYDGDKTVIEYLFENNLVDPFLIMDIKSHTEIYDLIMKYNSKKLINSITEEVLNMKRPNMDITILEELIIANEKINFILSSEESLKVALKHKRYDLLSSFPEEILLRDIESNKTILEFLLERNFVPSIFSFSDKRSMDIIYKMKRYDLMFKFDMDILLSNADLNNTYLDILIEESKKNPDKIRINKLYLGGILANDILAQIYIKLAKKGVLGYLEKPSAQRLMEVDFYGNRLIDELLKLDKDITLESIVVGEALENMELVLYLKMKGLEVNGYIFNEEETVLSEKYREDKNAELDQIQVSEEMEALLDEFRTIMLSDNQSDASLIEDVIRSYRRALASGSMYASRELSHLIDIKKNNPRFKIVRSDEDSYYSTYDNSVNLCDLSIDTINHELGHAMYDMLTEKQMPYGIEGVLERVRKNPEVMKRISEFTKKYYDIKEMVGKHVDEIFFADYEKNISPEKRRKIEEYLAKNKEEKIKEYKDLGYTHEEIEAMLDDVFTYDEYIKYDKKAKRSKLVVAIIEEEYPSLYNIADIIDSIFEGKFFNGVLTTEEGEKIIGFAGHGIEYYTARGLSIQFDENMANFSAIYKATGSSQIIEELRSIVGDEFVDMFSNYYEMSIVNSTKYEKERSM